MGIFTVFDSKYCANELHNMQILFFFFLSSFYEMCLNIIRMIQSTIAFTLTKIVFPSGIKTILSVIFTVHINMPLLLAELSHRCWERCLLLQPDCSVLMFPACLQRQRCAAPH